MNQSTNIKQGLKNLEEWGLDNLGNIISTCIKKEDRCIDVVFPATTVTLYVDEDIAYDNELVAEFDFTSFEATPDTNSGVTLTDIDICSTAVTLYLSNGNDISIKIDYNSECDSSGSYENVPYEILYKTEKI